MAAYNKFYTFVGDIAAKIHNLGSDQLTVALTDSAPTASNTVIANITQISYTNLSSRNITLTSSSQASGTYTLKLTNLTLTASGTIPQFRYIVIYNSTAANGPLISWFDNGSEVNMGSGDTYLVNFDATNGLLQLT